MYQRKDQLMLDINGLSRKRDSLLTEVRLGTTMKLSEMDLNRVVEDFIDSAMPHINGSD